MAKKKKIPGAEQFESYFSDLYKGRWPLLKEALLKDGEHMSFQAFPDGKEYFLDRASYLTALNLPLPSEEDEELKILDMCAAPGGKSLILASRLAGKGHLTCNELSPNRRGRLKKVLAEHLPEDWAQQTKVTGFDGSRWCLYGSELFDHILLDAPCSSERHVMTSPKHLEQWTAKRTKSLAIRQYALAASAIEILKPGGYLLYSTCSLSPMENDDLIEKVLKKRGDKVEHIVIDEPVAETEEDRLAFESTKYGTILLPDHSKWGPLYFSLLRKKVTTDSEN